MKETRSQRLSLMSAALILTLSFFSTDAFLTGGLQSSAIRHSRLDRSAFYSPTSLNIWWFGGAESEQTAQGDDSCELVPVRIERTSGNSRKIYGEIVAPVPLKDVWAILTDYDRLSTHVPNLVESRIVRPLSGGEMGDGNFQCRLFQKGAQKIVGFEFGADLTMEMKESIKPAPTILPSKPDATRQDANGASYPGNERRIQFKCCESFFFKEFDGEWKVTERTGETGLMETVLSYTVDVRPNGPVPVAALEWRIREDVPTNLRAVKLAAMTVGYKGVQASRQQGMQPASFGKSYRRNGARPGLIADLRVQWEPEETMAAYLKE
ncbi:predicted protein [Phaeodactylum tricornutum CCAP 1055/1]|uniref:Coenzyme Q-binding protein COQ10 START domain-containing protein n=1 Tax=Phaeodactylum tricornutum (strain CCAP 1055/1) TaxID=556484 RepID=B7G316_PHATC|nr:predicted protein [Phaeodactylum tricornutum CCAP 1055/1]EEC46924.1 predicted protein [Phaeodactylum tricornutum CCAP 1055/1]|eukprot:XP_002181710.1 predicted protein [Phaeodactylum tricornutum CCAP 1055/1]